MARRRLLVLTLCVLALHALVLRLLPAPAGPRPPAAPSALATRLLPPAPPPPAVAEPAPPPAPTTAPPRKTRTRTAPPPPAPTAEELAPFLSAIDPGLGISEAPTETPASADPALETAPTNEVAAAEPEPAGDTAPETLPPTSALTVQRPDSAVLYGPLSAVPAPPARLDFDVNGQVKGFHYSARAELLWQHDAAHYQARQTISAFLLGTRTQASEGGLNAHGLVPARFDDQARRLRSATLDFAQQQVRFSRPDTAPAPLLADAQDRLSIFLQLGALIAAAPADYPEGTQITIDTIGATSVEPWTFVVHGQETLELSGTSTPTRRLERLARGARAQTGELWLGTELGYLPVRIRLAEPSGDFAELALRRHETP